jgi:succinate dehydrogenase / fumarate reductase, iron-sulfur subunit
MRVTSEFFLPLFSLWLHVQLAPMSNLQLHLKVWRQPSTNAKGQFQDIEAQDIPDHASFLEMMDIVNERLITDGKEPVAFDHD